VIHILRDLHVYTAEWKMMHRLLCVTKASEGTVTLHIQMSYTDRYKYYNKTHTVTSIFVITVTQFLENSNSLYLKIKQCRSVSHYSNFLCSCTPLEGGGGDRNSSVHYSSTLL
jgi:hypothetical protein